jgi:hypothetical protein
MGGCPISCNCRRSPVGGFILACCAWAAVYGSVFLGGEFAPMITGLVFAPHILAPALAIWAGAVGVGLFLLATGVIPAVVEGDDGPSWALSIGAIAGGGIALGSGWTLPASWGVFWSLGSEGACWATIAAGATSLALNFAARGYEAGYLAGCEALPGWGDPTWQDRLDRQSAAIASLAAERDRLARELAQAGPPARDLNEVLRYAGVRRAVLKTLHRDSHPGIGDADARLLDERFKKASAVFERLGSE